MFHFVCVSSACESARQVHKNQNAQAATHLAAAVLSECFNLQYLARPENPHASRPAVFKQPQTVQLPPKLFSQPSSGLVKFLHRRSRASIRVRHLHALGLKKPELSLFWRERNRTVVSHSWVKGPDGPDLVFQGATHWLLRKTLHDSKQHV